MSMFVFVIALCAIFLVVMVVFRSLIFPSGNLLTRCVATTLLTVMIILISSGLYLYVGEPRILLEPWIAERHDTETRQTSLLQIEKIAQQSPNNANTWLEFAQAAMANKAYDSAIQAYEKIRRLQPQRADILIRLADAHTMKNNGKIQDKTYALLQQALTLEPENPQAIWLLAIAYEQRKDIKSAIQNWQKLLSITSENQQLSQQIREHISSLTTLQKNSPIRYQIHVQLANAVRNQVSAEQTVFIFLSEAGVAMPVAAIRRQVADLPAVVVLDESAALQPDKPLSSFRQLRATARISKTATPEKSSGDYYGTTELKAAQSERAYTIVINKQVP